MSDAARAKADEWLRQQDQRGLTFKPSEGESLAQLLDAYAAEQTAAKDVEIAGLKEDWRILLREHGEASQRAEAAEQQTAALRAALAMMQCPNCGFRVGDGTGWICAVCKKARALLADSGQL